MGRLGSRRPVTPQQLVSSLCSNWPVLSRSAVVVQSWFLVAFLCCHFCVVDVRAFVIGLGQISSFFLLPTIRKPIVDARTTFRLSRIREKAGFPTWLMRRTPPPANTAFLVWFLSYGQGSSPRNRIIRKCYGYNISSPYIFVSVCYQDCMICLSFILQTRSTEHLSTGK